MLEFQGHSYRFKEGLRRKGKSPRPPTPPGTTIGEPEVDGEVVKVTVTLPPGQMIGKLSYRLKVEGE